MPFNRPALSEIIQRSKTDLEGRLNDGKTALRRSVLAVIARTIAGASHLLHGHLDWVYRQAFADLADEDNLVRWGAIFGVERKAAEFAEGPYEFTGTNGTSIPALTQVQRSDGLIYETDAEVIISAGIAIANIVALTAGANGNADTGVTMNLVSPITGVDSEGSVQAPGISGGADEESIDDLRARVLSRIRQPPQGGNENDFVQWALEVPGVTRAWVYPLLLGAGTVGILFVRDNDTPSIIPDAGEIQDVQDYIDERRPVTANVTVLAPTEDPLNFTIQLTPNTAEVRAAVEEELKDFLSRESEPGGTLLLSQINEAISIADGEMDHILTVPNANVVAASGQLKTFGVVTWL